MARLKLCVALAAVISIWGSLEFFGFETEFQKQTRDPYAIAAQADRLEGVRAATPETAVLGYLTDADPSSVIASAIFSGAQYVLAPRLLRQDASGDLVLGNFTRPGDYAAIGKSHGLQVDRDFHNGVVLFRKESK
jgi:hypothetical protein